MASLNAQLSDAFVFLPNPRRPRLNDVWSEDALTAMLAKLVFPEATALRMTKYMIEAMTFCRLSPTCP